MPWSFPNTQEVIDFYRDCPAHKCSAKIRNTPAQLRRVGRSFADELAGRCTDSAVAGKIRKAGGVNEVIAIPALLHRVSIQGRPAWVLVLNWELTPAADHDAQGSMSCGHVEVVVYDAASGEVLESRMCG